MDRISELPDPLIHHIMSFLPTLHLTKTSILSKRLFFLWTTYPVIDFDQSTFNRGIPDSTTDDFLDHIHNSISLRRIDTAISEFRVKLSDLKWISATDSRLDSAISFAVDNGVKSMDLDFGFANYQFPVSFASRSISVLRLTGLSLDPNVILACPSLKTLFLTSCVILQDMDFSTQTLEEIKLHCCDVESIKIIAPKLHSFFFDSGTKDLKRCRIDVLECENIAHLSLNNVVSGHDWVEKHTSTLGKLETFVINGCEDIDSIIIMNDRVERVEIGNCRILNSIKVIAPSLESFQYNGSTHDDDDHDMVSNISFIGSKSIKDLYIENAGITDEWLEAQLTKLSCNSLRSLRLKGCNSLKKIEVTHEKLEILELLKCINLEEAKVMAPSLESFHYNGTHDHMVPNIRFIDLKSIKDVYIEDADITDEWLKAQLEFNSLRSLRLKGCNSLKKIHVIHEKLENLELLNCINLQEAEIDTPQLVSFVHLGNMIELEKMVTRSMCTANLIMNPWIDYNNKSFYGWKKLLSFFGHCRALKLICNCKKELIIPENLREMFVSPMYDLQSLEVHVKSLERIDSDLVDSLLWLSPLPNTIRISSASSPNSNLQMIIKFAYNEKEEEEEDDDDDDKSLVFCCRRKPVKCWRHKLRRLDIQTWDKKGSVELQKYFLTNAKMLETLSFTKLQDDFNLIN